MIPAYESDTKNKNIINKLVFFIVIFFGSKIHIQDNETNKELH